MEQRRNDQHNLQPPRMKPPEMPAAAAAAHNQTHQPPPPQKCPRCDSSNTKFCYYNNYSLSQPRYFCKACRRYWTHGGTLRNVPVGGGCRKSKRPKPSTPSPSSGGEIGRSQPLSPALPPHSLTGAALRPLPPIMSSSSMGTAFYSGGSFLSSLAAMQSLSNQGAAATLGGGSGQYEANMALLQSLKPPPPPPPPQHFQLQNDQYFPSQQNLRPSPSSWTQNFINRGPAPASAASSSFWSGAAAADGNNPAGSSFNPNHWQDSNPNPGFDPSSQ